MASREELAELALENERFGLPTNIPRITVRPQGVEAPPVTDVDQGQPWGAPNAAGRPSGRLFEPDQTPARKPITEVPEGWSYVRDVPPEASLPPWQGGRLLEPDLTLASQPPDPTARSRAMWERGYPSAGQGPTLGGLVSGAAAPQAPRAQVDPTAGSRQMWQQGYPSADRQTWTGRAASGAADLLGLVTEPAKQLVQSQITQFDPNADVYAQEAARERAPGLAAETAMNVVGVNAPFSAVRKGTAGVFGGRLAKGFDPNREKLAATMEANGVPPQQIWKDTGMVKFADGKWAHEIPDIGASYKGDVESIASRIFDQKYPDRKGTYGKYGEGVPTGNTVRSDAARQEALLKIQGNAQLYLPDVIDHPRLFEAYPELRKMPVSHDAFMHAQGVYYPESIAGKDVQQRRIKYREDDIGTRKGRGRTLDTLLHEIQHAIQQIEGMAKGSSTEPILATLPGTGANKIFLEEMKKFAKPLSETEYLNKYPATTKKEYADYMDDYRNRFRKHEDFTQQYAAEQAYPKSAGENVAELPGQRRLMTPEQLRANFPPNQFRVPMEQQDVEFNRLVNPAGTNPQAQMGGVLGLEGPQMSKRPSGLLGKPSQFYNQENWLPVKPTVLDPRRVFSPGVYENPRIIAEKAAEKVAAEHPALKELFGVTRADIYDISQQGRRKGNIEPEIFAPNKPGESYVAEGLATPQNEQRILDTLGEGLKHRGLREGMVPWYVMDPMFQHMVKLVGKEQAIKDYRRFNATTAPFSASSDVMTELNRGTAANMYAKRGDYSTFHQFAGADRNALPPGFPADMSNVAGHAYHAIQSDPVVRWLATGKHGYGKEIVKIPTYHAASGVPEVGFQTRWPVPDAHFARGVGAADVRDTAKPGVAMKGAEYRSMAPWYREKIAEPLGIEAVPAQALQWGTMSRATGVDTAIGAGKLELLAQRIWERAHELRMDPKQLRDMVLRGDAHALRIIGMAGGGAAGIGSIVAPNRQEVY